MPVRRGFAGAKKNWNFYSNVFAPNIGAPQYIRQMLTSMKGEINNNTIIVGDFNTPLTPMDRILLFLKLSLTVVGYSSFNCFKKIINLTN